MSWTDERIATLRELWEQGHSASQIAGRLGNVTRNAVIGKVHRLGLSGRPSPVRAERPARAPVPQPAAPRPVREAPAPVLRAKPQIVPPPAPPVAAVEPAARATLLSINDRMCKWPLGDPGQAGFHFCGRKGQTGVPYCAEHARVAYQATSPKRDKRDRERERERLLRNVY